MENKYVLVTAVYNESVSDKKYQFAYNRERMGEVNIGDILMTTVTTKTNNPSSIVRNMKELTCVDVSPIETASVDIKNLKPILINHSNTGHIFISETEELQTLKVVSIDELIEEKLKDRPTQEVIKIMLNGHSSYAGDEELNRLLFKKQSMQ